MKFSLILASQIFAAGIALAAEPAAPAAATPAPAAEAPAATETEKATEGSPASAEASGDSEALCKLSGKIRRVKLHVENQKCRVLYYKETEKPGTEDKLWEYNHDMDKCKSSFKNFVTKLTGMGWTCASS